MRTMIITIDTEGDSLWNNPDVVHTENALFIPRFQELCEKYGFKPVWLTDYEMAMDNRYMDYISTKAKRGLCEVGIHVHARNNPPINKLENERSGAAYLIEYPVDVMRHKFIFLKELLENKLGLPIVTHRAGRWALNQEYIDILIEEGIQVDCSVTPGIDWTSYPGITPDSRGSDYTKSPTNQHSLFHSCENKSIEELPMTIIRCEKLFIPSKINVKSILRASYHYLKKVPLWMRSGRNNLNEMKYILKKCADEKRPYVEYMIHSSELMPGGSPTFPSEESIEQMYAELEKLFIYAKKLGYAGSTIAEYVKFKGDPKSIADTDSGSTD